MFGLRLTLGHHVLKQTRNMPTRKQTWRAAHEILLLKYSILFPSLLLTCTEQPQETTLPPQDSSCPSPLLILSSLSFTPGRPQGQVFRLNSYCALDNNLYYIIFCEMCVAFLRLCTSLSFAITSMNSQCL